MGTIKDLPVSDRPREKAFKYGIDILSDTELLTIIIGKGIKNKSALTISSELLLKYQSLNNIICQSVEELIKNEGINVAKAIELKAIEKIAKGYHYSTKESNEKLTTPEEVYRIFKNKYDGNENEKIVIFYLNNTNRVIYEKVISIGDDNNSIMPVKLICKTGLEKMAKKVMVAHNHPSDDVSPSKYDLVTTYDLKESLKLIKITLLDHVIVGDSKCYSMRFKKEYKMDF